MNHSDKYRKIIQVLKIFSLSALCVDMTIFAREDGQNNCVTMYERKIPVDLDCPLRLTMSLIGAKWKSCILDELRHGALRPSELHKLFPEAAPRVLDLQLKELVEDGLVEKTIYPELPPRSEYAITELGSTLLPLIDAMIEWGAGHTALFERKFVRPKR